MDIGKTLENEIISQIREKGFSKDVETELIQKIIEICNAHRSERRMNESSLKQFIERIGELSNE